ncbi:hypothetical protein ACEPAG_6237 [Sanghuangporus baumii]
MHTRRRANTDVSETEQQQQLFYFPRMDSLHHQQQQQQGAGLGTSSQGLVRHRNNLSSFSLSSHMSLPNRVSTLEAYELIYGDGPTPGAIPTETIERLYEADAGACHKVVLRYRNVFTNRMQCHTALASQYPSIIVYENPLVTASSRHIIGEINTVSRQLRELDVPRPLAMFKTLFRPSETYEEARESWFQVLRVWSEIDEMYDSESFDGHRLSIIEHTLNVLIFPGLHSDGRAASDVEVSSSVVSLPTTIGGHVTNPKPVLAIPGLRRLPLPSPLHLKLHVISRLSFNEQGRITRHRDFYDVRDVLALVPGVRAAQWIGTRAAAQGLAFASRLTGWVFGKKGGSNDTDSEDDVSSSVSPIYTSSFRRPDMNALGLHFSEGRSYSSASKAGRPAGASRPCQAPDVDRDAE